MFISGGLILSLPPSLRANSRAKSNGSIRPTEVTILSGLPRCNVDADGTPLGQTGPRGQLVVTGIPAGDHYFHADCPSENEVTRFLSLKAAEHGTIDLRPIGARTDARMTPLEAAAARIRLRRMVEQALQFRSEGQFDNAVKLLREATALDPNNPDLHRELGITFLLNHDWARGRIEMLEALRHEPNSADAHNDLGYALEKLGELKAALAQYRLAHRLDPTNDTYREHYFGLLAQLSAQAPSGKRR